MTEDSKVNSLNDTHQIFKFDLKWYAKNNNLNPNWSEERILSHYDIIGITQGLQPSPFFSPSYVIEQLQKQKIDIDDNPLDIFLKNSSTINPHVLLPTKTVQNEQNANLLYASEHNYINESTNALLTMDDQHHRNHIFFDPSFIKDQNGNPSKSPLNFYLRNLFKTNVQTSVLFDPEFYAGYYPDVVRDLKSSTSLNNLLEHFLRYGIFEQKLPFPDIDVDFYLDTNPDIAENNINPIEHFLNYGIREHRDPNPYFNTSYYLENQPDVNESIKINSLTGPFEHFLKYGYNAGYKTRNPLHSMHVSDQSGKALYEKRCNVTTTALMKSAGVIDFPEFEGKPELSCIIPVIDQGHMTIHLLTLLSSIAWRQDMPSIEVVIVDNGSTDLTLQLKNLTKGAKILRSIEPLGYPRACNWGANEASGDVLLFMNNDIEVHADALRRGVQRLATMPEIGAVGGRILSMNGSLQEAGSLLNDDGSAAGLGRSTDPDLPINYALRRVDYCSGCLLFVRQNDFNAIGGFDEVFNPGYYEEADLCFRLKQNGLGTLMDPLIYAYHYEYASFSKGRPEMSSFALMARNKKIFRERHIQKLSNRPSHNSAEGKKNLRQSFVGKSLNIAILEDVIPDCRIGSGFVRTTDLIDSLLKKGHRITIFANDYMAKVNEDIWRQKGVEVVKLFRTNSSASPLSGREWDFDLLWVCRTHNILTWSKHLQSARQLNPNIKFIIDTEAVVTLRKISHAKLQDQMLVQDRIEMLKSELSIDTLLVPSVIIAVNELDRSFINELQISKSMILGHKMPVRSNPAGIENRKDLFFCGSIHAKESPNYDSLEWFINEVWPHIQKALPNTKFNIVGHCAEKVSLSELINGAQGISYLGRVDDLKEFMDNSRAFVAPTRFAGGIPHKVHEAMANGLPVIATDLLRSQLVEHGETVDNVPILSSDSNNPKKFAAACCDALRDDDLWENLQSDALNFIERTASDVIFEANLQKILDSIQ